MAESTNDPKLTNKGSKVPDKNADGQKNHLAGIGAPAAGAATGAAVAAGIKFSDEIIEAIGGNPETETTPDLDPNEPTPPPQANSNTVTTSATPINHPQTETAPQGNPEAAQNDHDVTDQTDGTDPQPQYETEYNVQGADTPGKHSGEDEIIEAVEADQNYPDVYLVDTDGDGSYDAVEMDFDHDGVIDALYADDEYAAREEPDHEASYPDETGPDDMPSAYEDNDIHEDYDDGDAFDLDTIL